jgi:hypothetical protein
MSEISPSAPVRPPEARLVHNGSNDVEGVYPFPARLGRRAATATGAGFDHIDHTILRGGLAPIIQRTIAEVSKEFIDGTIPGCEGCIGSCGLLVENGPAHGFTSQAKPMHLYITAGVDRAKHDEPSRFDRPLLLAYVRCYNALEPQAPENYGSYARAQVEKIPEGKQFKESCHVVMGKIALATFNHFDERLTKLESIMD